MKCVMENIKNCVISGWSILCAILVIRGASYWHNMLQGSIKPWLVALIIYFGTHFYNTMRSSLIKSFLEHCFLVQLCNKKINLRYPRAELAIMGKLNCRWLIHKGKNRIYNWSELKKHTLLITMIKEILNLQ